MMPWLRRHWDLVIPILIAGFSAILYRAVLAAPILGYDSFALIITSRIRSHSEFIDTFTNVMMDGRLDVGDFYRPVANLSYALDYALGGFEPNGYQLTSLLTFCAAVLVLYLLMRRLLGPNAWIGPTLATLFFALHPATLTILPYVARRSVPLMLIFAGLALLALPKQAGRGDWRRLLLAGLLAAFSMASKANGICTLGLIFIHQALSAQTQGIGEALRRGARAVAIAIGPSLVVLLARVSVIGGIGGYHISESQSYAEKFVDWGPKYVASILSPEYWSSPALDLLLPLASALLLIGLCIGIIWKNWQSGGTCLDGIPRVICLGAAFFGALVILAANSMHFTPRYSMAMSFATALVIGAVAEAATRLAFGRADRGGVPVEASRPGVLPILLAGGLAAVCGMALQGSILIRSYPEWTRATRTQTQFLTALEQKIESSPPYEYIAVNIRRSEPVISRTVEPFWMLAPWGLQAWLDLRFPERPYKVILTPRHGVDTIVFAPVTLHPLRADSTEISN